MVLLGIKWCLLPHGRLPRFRVRYLRVRLLLRLHPGRGHASVAELWLRWSKLAMFRRSRRSRWSPPRKGKTGLLAKLVLRYPGPVVSTTTKADVFGLTSGVCGRGPVEVFNPQGIGGVPSTFRWNPVDGCEQESVAIRRADGSPTRSAWPGPIVRFRCRPGWPMPAARASARRCGPR